MYVCVCVFSCFKLRQSFKNLDFLNKAKIDSNLSVCLCEHEANYSPQYAVAEGFNSHTSIFP